jgi:hypothetical protein
MGLRLQQASIFQHIDTGPRRDTIFKSSTNYQSPPNLFFLLKNKNKKKNLFFFRSKAAAADPENRESPATLLLIQHAVQRVSSGGRP